jgi:hypothetical protein
MTPAEKNGIDAVHGIGNVAGATFFPQPRTGGRRDLPRLRLLSRVAAG